MDPEILDDSVPLAIDHTEPPVEEDVAPILYSNEDSANLGISFPSPQTSRPVEVENEEGNSEQRDLHRVSTDASMSGSFPSKAETSAMQFSGDAHSDKEQVFTGFGEKSRQEDETDASDMMKNTTANELPQSKDLVQTPKSLDETKTDFGASTSSGRQQAGGLILSHRLQPIHLEIVFIKNSRSEFICRVCL